MSFPFFFFVFAAPPAGLGEAAPGTLEKDLRASTPPSFVARRSSMTSGGGSGFLHLSSMPSGMSLGVGEVGLAMALEPEEEDAPEEEARPAPGMAVDDRAGGGDEDEDEEAPGTGGLGPATGTGEVVR